MALSAQDQKDILALLGRAPTAVEESVFDTMWSEHCSYKSSKPLLKGLPTKGSEVTLGVGEDSGIIHFTEHNGHRYGIAISHESHNHPSQILPIEGSATGVGGVVRDVYCMGAEVIGVLDSLHFGVPDTPGQGLAAEIADKVVEGVAEYGNALGVPVLGGETIYHPSYNDNCLVNVAALGVLREDQIIRSKVPEAAKHTPYVMILFGKSTDSTGFGGASFSSAVLDEDDEMANLGAVQVHDPFMKRMLVASIKELVDRVNTAGVQIGFKDLGAGGISCAASELASAGGFGCDLNLDDVNVAVDGLAPEVIACSETQERFCVAVPESFADEVITLFNEEFELPNIYPNAGAAIIGKITQEPRFIMRHKGELVCDLSVTAITTEVLADRKIEPRQINPASEVNGLDVVKASGTWGGNPDGSLDREALLAQLASLIHASKRYVYRNYDNAVRGDTVVYPGEADAVVVTPVEGCDAALAVSIDSNTYGDQHPYLAAACAVAESVRNVVAVGARPMAVTDCLNYGNPEIPNVLWDFKEGLRGIKESAEALSFVAGDPVPIISGNVSFYNESKSGNAVVPSPVIVVTGKMPDYRQALTMQLRETDSTLIHIQYSGALLQLDKEAAQNKAVHGLISAGRVRACHDISQGGTWQSVVEMMLGERGVLPVGVALDFTGGFDKTLLSENGGFIIEVANDDADKILSELIIANLDARIMGVTNGTAALSLSTDNGEVQFTADELLDAWNVQNASHVGVRL